VGVGGAPPPPIKEVLCGGQTREPIGLKFRERLPSDHRKLIGGSVAVPGGGAGRHNPTPPPHKRSPPREPIGLKFGERLPSDQRKLIGGSEADPGGGWGGTPPPEAAPSFRCVRSMNSHPRSCLGAFLLVI
jgi:hypothetical protein